MQDGGTSSIKFHKVLQDKYHRFKADIRNQAKTKVRQIIREKPEEMLEQRRKEGKKRFFTKSFLYLRYQGCQGFLKHESLPP